MEDFSVSSIWNITYPVVASKVSFDQLPSPPGTSASLTGNRGLSTVQYQKFVFATYSANPAVCSSMASMR